jgi:cytochrome c-type biogenesis protein CcmH/NrfG
VSRTPEELREALEERRRHALRDLEELAEQVEAGDIDEDSAAELEAGYRTELEAVEERLERLPAAARSRERAAKPEAARRPTARRAAKDEVPRSRSTRTMLIAMGAVMVVLSVLIYVAAQGGDDEPAAGGSGTTDATEFASSGDGIADLEALVAAHPESIDFRLQLAGAYFDRGIQQRNTGQNSSESLFAAVQHYAAVYESADAGNPEKAHAASRLGFLAFETQQYGQSVALLEEAMALDPANVEPEWFLGLVLFEGQQDPAAAIPVFESVLARPDLPDWLRDAATDMLAAAESAAGGGG